MAEEVVKHCINLPTHLRVQHPQTILALLRDAAKDGQNRLKLLSLGTIATHQLGEASEVSAQREQLRH